MLKLAKLQGKEQFLKINKRVAKPSKWQEQRYVQTLE